MTDYSQFHGRNTPSVSRLDFDALQPSMPRVRAYRLERVREQLRKLDVAGAVLFDPLNIRYATGSRNMQLWMTHNPARYAFVATDGPASACDRHGFVAEGRRPIDSMDFGQSL